MTSRFRLLPMSLCACLLAACGVPLDGSTPPLEQQAFAAGNDDSHSQGTQLHGTPVTSVSYAGATVRYVGTHRSASVRLVRGELVASMPLQVSGTTPSLQGCSGFYALGVSRSCGWGVEGQGVCTPGATISLTSGACGLERGSCTGNPIVRVCSGERPCEHQGSGYLASGDNATACSSSCPNVQFVCPASGIYTVLAAASSPGSFWSLSLAESSGRFPATVKELRGTELVGAKLLTQPGATTGTLLEVAEVVNADSVVLPDGQSTWDASGDTLLYRVRYGPSYATPTTELCASSAGAAGWAWAVPVKGVFGSTGSRQDSTTVFTLACEAGVIAKCYRWGYKPWLDGSLSGNVTQAHHACTRMARADYCGNGTSYTQDGTRIRPWDSLVPSIIAAPDAGTSGMTFEAGWKGTGPACLSHWRWKHLPAQQCVELNPPLYSSDGGIRNDCRNPASGHGTTAGATCSQICDTPEEAQDVYGSRVFNRSASNGLDGGVGN